MDETMNDSHPHTPDLIFTAAVAAAQRAAADSVAAAVLAAERRGYERGLAEARQAAAAAPARLPDDAVEALRRALRYLPALREIVRGLEALEDCDRDEGDWVMALPMTDDEKPPTT